MFTYAKFFLCILFLNASFFSCAMFDEAITKNDTKALENLIRTCKTRKALIENINRSDDNASTPLHKAVEQDNAKLVEILLKNGAQCSINEVNDRGRTPLWLALLKNNQTITEQLLSCGAEESVNTACNQKFTPLMLAIKNNNISIIHLLFKHGASKSINATREGLDSALRAAVADNYLDIVKFLLFFNATISDNLIYIPTTTDDILLLIKNPDQLKQFCTQEEWNELLDIRLEVNKFLREEKSAQKCLGVGALKSVKQQKLTDTIIDFKE